MTQKRWVKSLASVGMILAAAVALASAGARVSFAAGSRETAAGADKFKILSQSPWTPLQPFRRLRRRGLPPIMAAASDRF